MAENHNSSRAGDGWTDYNRNSFELPQVSVRLVQEPPLLCDEPLKSPEAAIRVMGGWLRQMDRELVCVVNLQNDLQPINMSICSMGTLNSSLVHPREVMKAAILSNAACFMLIHNHPSGSLEPSRQDVALTDRLQQAGELLGIPLIEHIIIGRGLEYFSFKEKDVLPFKEIQYTADLDRLDISGMIAAEESAACPEETVSQKTETSHTAKAVHKTRHRGR